jgi:hypothetical protein
MPALTSDTLDATGSVTLTKPATDNVVFISASGTYGTVSWVVEGSVDGTNFFALTALAFADGTNVTGTVSPLDNATVGYKVPADGLGKVRLRVTAIASGSVAVTLRSDALVGGFMPLTANFSAMTFGATTFSGDLTLADSDKLKLGTDSDITVAWDGTDLDVLQAAANSSVKWGVDGAGIDQVWYGDTASTSMTWDQSADTLLFTGTAYVAGNKMATVANTDGSITVDATHSGKVITTRGAAGATTVTLPTVAAGLTGVHFWVFNCVDQDLTLSAQTAGQIMFKHDVAADSVAASTASEKIGAAFFVHCDGTSWLVMPMCEEAVTLTVT